RMKVEQSRVDWLLDTMMTEVLSPIEKVHQLRRELAEYYNNQRYLSAETMGQLLKVSLDQVRKPQ
ncbi:MAG: hypothetical protein ABIP97_02600, partial [Chthoniobacterales bacterium]